MGGVATGALRHRVSLQAPQILQDEVTGEQGVLWVTVAEPWAAIVPSSGRDYMAAGAEQSEVRGRITIRYRDSVTSEMRVVHRGFYYNILAVLPDADSGIEHLSLMVSEGVRLGQ